MPSLHHKLGVLSRDRNALIRGAAIVLAVFFGAGTLAGMVSGHTDLYFLIMTAVSMCGLIWFTIISKLCGVREILEWRTFFAVIALVLGIFSAITTGNTIAWFEDITGLKENGEVFNDFLYCIARIGFQEEFIKMAFILPLIPFVLRRRSEAEMILVSACVGLGFAVEENIYYFHKGIDSTLGRLLTANFLHMAMTGMIGLALFRFFRWPKSRWEEFLGTFIAIVIIHGLYDALIIIEPIQKEYGIFSFIIFAILAHRFFDLIQDTRENVSQKISPLGVFVIGCSALIGLTWVIARSVTTWHQALQIAGNAALSTGVIAFLFINRLRSE